MSNEKYYVTMTDNFMSGWGIADKKLNKLVFECASYSQACIVVDNAECRTDQKYINICKNKPYYNKKYYYTQYKTIANYPNWYRQGYFKRRDL